MPPGPARPILFAMPSTPGFGEKLRAVFGLSPTILCLTGLSDGRVRDANDAFLSTSGYTREEILGRTPVELGLWVDPAQRDEGIRLLKAGRTVRGLECRFRVKSGEERVTVLSADVVMFDGEACILSALTDITDRTRAEAALRESERRFMVAFHANPLPDVDHEPARPPPPRGQRGGGPPQRLLARGDARPDQAAARLLGDHRAARARCCASCTREGRVRDLEVTFRTRARRGAPAPGQLGGHHLRERARGAERVARHHRAQAVRGVAPRREPGQGRVPRHARPRAAQPARHADQRGGGARAAAGRRHHAPRGRDHRPPDRAPRPAGGRSPRRGPRDVGQDRAAAPAGGAACPREPLHRRPRPGRPDDAAHRRSSRARRCTWTATRRGSSRC